MRRLNSHRDCLQIMPSVYIFWNVKGEFPIFIACQVVNFCKAIEAPSTLPTSIRRG